jgi:hypothetical protein
LHPLVFQFRHVRQVPAFKRCPRIIHKQRPRFFLTEFFLHHFIRRPQLNGPRTGVVRVAAHKMNQPRANPAQRVVLRTGSKPPRHRSPGHLCVAAMPHPGRQPLWLRSQQPVPLRVRHNQPHPRQLHLVQRLVHCRRNRNFVELHQQVIFLVDAESQRVRSQQFHIFRIQMKIASGCQRQPLPHLGLQLFTQRPHFRVIEKKFRAGMRSRHQVGYALGNRRFRHLHRLFHRVRPVVQPWKDVAMQINHVVCAPSARGASFHLRPSPRQPPTPVNKL